MKFPEHAFISFSTRDQEIARSIAEHLHGKGVPVWIAPEALTPGTQNWEASIREALGRSFAVVLLASEDSRQSPYVFAELEVAEANGCRVLPVWVRGSDWANCVPLRLVSSQRIDLREGEQGPALESLCRSLQDAMRGAMPKRYLENYSVRYHRTPGNCTEVESTRRAPPPGYITVDLGVNATDHPDVEQGKAAYLRTADYTCLGAVLDDLYLSCLQDRFRPYTYGTDWILKLHSWSCGVLLVPWLWLTDPSAPHLSIMESHIDTPTSALLVGRRPVWEIRSPRSVAPLGLALHDEQLLSIMLRHPKALAMMMREVLRECAASEVADQAYAHRFVIDWPPFGPDHQGPRGGGAPVLAQTAKSVPDRLLKYWRGDRD